MKLSLRNKMSLCIHLSDGELHYPWEILIFQIRIPATAVVNDHRNTDLAFSLALYNFNLFSTTLFCPLNVIQ